MEKFQKNNKRAGPNNQAGWKISKKLINEQVWIIEQGGTFLEHNLAGRNFEKSRMTISQENLKILEKIKKKSEKPGKIKKKLRKFRKILRNFRKISE